MIDNEKKEAIIQLLHQEIVLALGCTEPVAVALAAAKARELLGTMPDTIEVYLSSNVLKNAMGVGIPGTGMNGLPIAIAIGIVGGKSEKGLEVLNVSPEIIEKSKEWLTSHPIDIKLKPTNEKLYIECTCRSGNDSATASIVFSHSNFVYLAKNGTVLLDTFTNSISNKRQEKSDTEISAFDVYEFATTAPISDICFIADTASYNIKASHEGLKGYGLSTGKTIMEIAQGNIIQEIIARTASASDARMAGCTTPVYSNSGSGNQGITCTVPVYEYAQYLNKTEEETLRALTLSHLMSIYIKQKIGRLSALCGVVNASIGVSAAVTFLQGGSFEQISFTIKNMINNITGMVCDGAKPSCALKVSTGIYAAFLSAELAMRNKVVEPTDGISEKDLERSINNLARIGAFAMNETDNVILDIMTHKKN